MRRHRGHYDVSVMEMAHLLSVIRECSPALTVLSQFETPTVTVTMYPGMSCVLLGFIEYLMLFLYRKRRQAMPQYRLDYHALSEIQVFGM